MVMAVKENLPDELKQVVASALAELKRSGHPEEDAERIAFRRANHAGWYLSPDGWQQLGPDLRDKINVRRAVEQPDGRYLVPDVDVFYPNAVKGPDKTATFAPEDVARAIKNTNLSTQHGGQKPSITKEHPSPLAKALGNPSCSYGGAINFRNSPRGEGWARCDLVDVDPELIDEWKKGRYVGLSAGFVNDAGDLNLRFGHIAMLGGDMQALSLLPVTEIFSANQLCFSTDSSVLQPMKKGTTMDVNVKNKALASHFNALGAAYAALAAGEPGADAKVAEASQKYEAARAQFEGEEVLPPTGEGEKKEGHEDETEDMALIEEMLGEKPKAGPEACSGSYEAGVIAGYEAAQAKFAANPSEETVVNAAPEGEAADDSSTTETEVETPEAKIGSNYAAELTTANGQIAKLTQQVNALVGKAAKSEFAAICDKLQKDGHQFNAGNAVDALVKAGPNADARNAIIAVLKGTPKSGLSSGGRTFSAQDADNPAAKRTADAPQEEVDQVVSMLNQQFPGMNFSADDVRLGNNLTGKTQ